MEILVVTLAYPNNESSASKIPILGMFVKEQVESLRKCCPNLNIDVYLIPSYKSVLEYFRAMFLLPGIIKRTGYDIVHAHFGLTLLSLIFVKVPVVVTFHGSDLLVSPARFLCKRLARRASKVIVVAPRLRDALGYGEVIPCGIKVERFLLPPNHYKTSVQARADCLRVLFPSNPWVKVKNYGLFQTVCQELERRGYRVERVHLTNINRADVPKVFWTCDLMVLTSFSEGSPVVIKEAIAAKLPFVSVDVGDVKEWAESVEFGEVVQNRAPKIIADKVIELLGRIKSRQLLDNSKCLEAMEIYSIAKKINRVYYETLESRL